MLEELEHIWQKLKANPRTTILFLLVAAILVIVGTPLTSYLSEKGRQWAAGTSEKSAAISDSSDNPSRDTTVPPTKQSPPPKAKDQSRQSTGTPEPREERVISEVISDPPPDERGTPVRQVSPASKPTPPPRPPRVVVLAGDESGSAWTPDITVEQLERAFVLSSKVRPILRSKISADAIGELSEVPLHDLARLSETAKKIGARYVVIGQCFEVVERVEIELQNFRPVSWSVVVRIQPLDAETGEIVATHGFNGREGPMHNLDSKAAYLVLMKRFASDFVGKVEPQLEQTALHR